MHGVVAFPFAYLLWKKTGSKKLVALLFVATYLVDLDHLVDYFSFYGIKFNLADFFVGDYFDHAHKAYIPFHAWEWIVLLGIIAKIRGWKSYYTAILLGLIPHYVLDFLVMDNFFFYSLTYRAINNFTFL